MSLFPRHIRLPEMNQRRRAPRGQYLYNTLRAIDGLDSAGIIAAQEPDDAMVTPSEI